MVIIELPVPRSMSELSFWSETLPESATDSGTGESDEDVFATLGRAEVVEFACVVAGVGNAPRSDGWPSQCYGSAQVAYAHGQEDDRGDRRLCPWAWQEPFI